MESTKSACLPGSVVLSNVEVEAIDGYLYMWGCVWLRPPSSTTSRTYESRKKEEGIALVAGWHGSTVSQSIKRQ